MRWVLLFQWNNWIRRIRNYEQRRFFRGEEFLVFAKFLERFRKRKKNNRALFLLFFIKRWTVQRTFFEKSSSSNTSTGEEWRNNFLFQILNPKLKYEYLYHNAQCIFPCMFRNVLFVIKNKFERGSKKFWQKPPPVISLHVNKTLLSLPKFASVSESISVSSARK